MVDVTITVTGDNEVRKFLDNLPSFLYDGARKGLEATLLRAQSGVVANFNTSGSPLSANKLTSRSGRLAKSIRTEITGNDLKTLSGQLFTRTIYAPIQEEGGTITAKNAYGKVPGGPYLNIPTKQNKTSAGVQRMSAREVFANGGFIFKSKAGNWIVALPGIQLNEFGTIDNVPVPMFILKKSVTIRPRLGMVKSAVDQIPYYLNLLDNLRLE